MEKENKLGVSSASLTVHCSLLRFRFMTRLDFDSPDSMARTWKNMFDRETFFWMIIYFRLRWKMTFSVSWFNDTDSIDTSVMHDWLTPETNHSTVTVSITFKSLSFVILGDKNNGRSGHYSDVIGQKKRGDWLSDCSVQIVIF